jgi:hypothetical protein
MPAFSAERPESLWPDEKNLKRASQETIGLVNQKNTARSMTVVMPSAKAKPLTTPIAKMNSTTAASSDTMSATTHVIFARSHPASTATRTDLPSRISSRIRSNSTMKESAVMPMPTISPAMPGNVRVNPAFALRKRIEA